VNPDRAGSDRHRKGLTVAVQDRAALYIEPGDRAVLTARGARKDDSIPHRKVHEATRDQNQQEPNDRDRQLDTSRFESIHSTVTT
jgi:hypothetical protein